MASIAITALVHVKGRVNKHISGFSSVDAISEDLVGLDVKILTNASVRSNNPVSEECRKREAISPLRRPGRTK